MDADQYRATLFAAVDRPGPTESPVKRDDDVVLALTGDVRGLGAKGTPVPGSADGRTVTRFTRAEVRAMIARLRRNTGD